MSSALPSKAVAMADIRDSSEVTASAGRRFVEVAWREGLQIAFFS